MEFKLKELGKIITGKTPSKNTINAYAYIGLPFLTPKDMGESKYSNSTERYLSLDAQLLLKNSICKAPSISVSCIGSDMGKVLLNKKTIISNQQINTIVQINEKIVDVDYLYYLLKTKKKYLHNIAGGSTMPIVNKKQFEELVVNLPRLIIQKRIKNILSVLDKNIELNNKIISNLEKLSQTLFKHWFIDFEFPNEEGKPYKSSGGEMVESELGEIPKGWKVDNLSNIAEIVMGQSPKSETYNNENIGLPLLNGAADFKNCNISPNKYTSDAKKIGKKGDFVFGVRATIGLVTELDNTYAIGRGAGIATSLMKEGKEYLYEVLKKAFNEFQYTASGSVYLNISKNDLKDYKIVNPTNNTIKKYHSIVSVNTIQKENLIQENKNLTQLRDTLLPKLLSGEIEIPDELEV